jgi:hypothetical protein
MCADLSLVPQDTDCQQKKRKFWDLAGSQFEYADWHIVPVWTNRFWAARGYFRWNHVDPTAEKFPIKFRKFYSLFPNFVTLKGCSLDLAFSYLVTQRIC